MFRYTKNGSILGKNITTKTGIFDQTQSLLIPNIGPTPTQPINVLWIAADSGSYYTNAISNIISVNNSIGYPLGTSINLTWNYGDISSIYQAGGYDCLAVSSNYGMGYNMYSTINNFLAAGKGVVLFMFAHAQDNTTLYNNIGQAAKINTSGTYTYTYNNQYMTISGTQASIMNGVTYCEAQGYMNYNFYPVSGAYFADDISYYTYRMCIYKDNPTGSRRVDLNMWAGGSWQYYAATSGNARLALNSFYWAAKKTL